MINYYALLMPILYSIWPVCVSENETSECQNIIRYTGVCIASFCMCAYCLNQIYTPVMSLEMLQKSQKQQKIVFKTILLWSFTLKKAEICASNDISHFFWAISEK